MTNGRLHPPFASIVAERNDYAPAVSNTRPPQQVSVLQHSRVTSGLIPYAHIVHLIRVNQLWYRSFYFVTPMHRYLLSSISFHYHIYHIWISLLSALHSFLYKVDHYVLCTSELVLLGFPKTTVHFVLSLVDN